MSQVLRTAIIGGGKISEQHLSSLKSIPGTKVMGLCDLSPAMARFTAERFQLPAWFTDYRKMLKATEPQVVHVLTPPATHERLVRDCLEAGCHVIVEKPVALSNARFRNLWNFANERELRLIENHNYRFNSPVQQLSRLVTDGRIGTIKEVEVRMVLGIRGGGRYADANLPHPSHRLPAGVIHEFISHLCYLLLNFFPADPLEQIDSIRAAWRNHGGGVLFQYDDLDATILAGDVHGRLRFSCHQWPDCFSVDVRGSQGHARCEIFHPLCQVSRRRHGGDHLSPVFNAISNGWGQAFSGLAGLWNKVRNRTAYEGLDRFLQLSYRSLIDGTSPPVDFQHMNDTSRLIDALLAPENRV
jgi:predicted dehydrogenase